MPKLLEPFDVSGYAPVATRVSAFYERYPDGRIITQLWERSADEVVFRALVYRYQGDTKPAATGWAAEREGDGDINLVACLENTETSAIGRALANLGFTASTQRPSAEEMIKASRTRVRLSKVRSSAASTLAPSSAPAETSRESYAVADDEGAGEVEETLRLLHRARSFGLRLDRARRWRIALLSSAPDPERLRAFELRLRKWIAKHSRARETHE
jgi:hypothetical protein